MTAYRALLARSDLDGQAVAAVFKPPRGYDGGTSNVATYFSRFDRDIGDGRIDAADPRLDPFASRAAADQIAMSLPPHVVKWEEDPRPLSECLRSWAKGHGWTRAQAAGELRVPLDTYQGWCAGKSATAMMVRRMMDLIDAAHLRGR